MYVPQAGNLEKKTYQKKKKKRLYDHDMIRFWKDHVQREELLNN